MTDPKQPTDKVVLNAISYKENNDGKIGYTKNQKSLNLYYYLS